MYAYDYNLFPKAQLTLTILKDLNEVIQEQQQECQNELAEITGIPLRTIQQYEQ